MQPRLTLSLLRGFGALALVGGALGFIAPAQARAEGIVFPADAGIVDVTKLTTILRNGAPISDVNAIPDDGLDDTVALQNALNGFGSSSNRIIYLPHGVYEVSAPLQWPDHNPAQPEADDYSQREKRTMLQGQSRDGTILRLRPNSPRFGNHPDGTPNAADILPLGVIITGYASPDRFRNSVRDLSVETGTQNPMAVGIQFFASNQGTLRNVRISGQGRHGLDLSFSRDNGPLFIRNVEIDGFQIGIFCGNSQSPNPPYTTGTRNIRNSAVLEDIRLTNQTVNGIVNSHTIFTLRGLRSTNAVTALKTVGGVGVFTLLDARFTGLPGASTRPAIDNDNVLYLRNVSQSGYARLLDNADTSSLSNGLDIPGTSVSEFHTANTLFSGGLYVTRPANNGFPTAPHGGAGTGSLCLPIKETPAVPWDDPALNPWVNVMHSFPDSGGTLRPGAVGNGTTDDTAAIQRAIDSTANSPVPKTLYFPAGRSFSVTGTVFIRHKIHRVTGCESVVRNNGTLALVEQAGGPAVVVIERLDAGTTSGLRVEQRSSRTLVVSSCSLNLPLRTVLDPANPLVGSGDLFIDDFAGRLELNKPGQSTWLRQFNPESTVANGLNIVNRGANLWILGLKTEQSNTVINTYDGGRTELLGHYHIINGKDPRTHVDALGEPVEIPFAVVGDAAADAAFSIVNPYHRSDQGYSFDPWIEETRAGVTRFSSRPHFYAAYATFTPFKLGVFTATPHASYDSATSTATVSGGGSGIGATADSAHFYGLTQRLNGDGEFVARLDSLSNAAALTQAGLMLRDAAAPDAANVALLRIAGPTPALRSQARAASGGGTATSAAVNGLALPLWFRLVRTGASVAAYYRTTDTAPWTLLQSHSAALGGNVLAGLVVTQPDTAAPAPVAVFSNVRLTAAYPNLPANPPTGLIATATTDDVALSWSDRAANETGYRLERGVGVGPLTPLIELPANATSFRDTAVVGGQSYRYRVLALDDAGASTASNVATATVPAFVVGATLAIPAEADAELRAGIHANTNISTGAGITVKEGAGDGRFSVLLIPTSPAGANRLAGFASKENTSAAARPALVLQYAAGSRGAWLAQHFTLAELRDPAISGDAADPNHDGIGNLVAYVLGLDPRAAFNSAALPVVAVRSGHLTLTYRRLKSAPGATLVAEVAASLTGTWSNDPAAVDQRWQVLDDGAFEIITARDGTPTSDAAKRFLRLRVAPQ